MDEFFTLTESLSPRLEWMRRNSIQTAKRSDEQWVAWKGNKQNRSAASKFGNGQTEDDSLLDLATKLKIRLWNEQTISVTGVAGNPARVTNDSPGVSIIGVVDDDEAAGGDIQAEECRWGNYTGPCHQREVNDEREDNQ